MDDGLKPYSQVKSIHATKMDGWVTEASVNTTNTGFRPLHLVGGLFHFTITIRFKDL